MNAASSFINASFNHISGSRDGQVTLSKPILHHIEACARSLFPPGNKLSQLTDYLLRQEARVVELQTGLTAIPAIGPENGGQGEMAKAGYIYNVLRDLSAPDIIDVNAPDPRVKSSIRPNIIARFPGHSAKTLWLFGHMDVVPPGDLALWDSDPWQVRQEGDLLYGRGVEDNQQAIVSMLLLAEGLQKLEITPELSLGLVFMADEENGSKYGLDWILAQKPEIFHPDDLYIAADGGLPDGSGIEIAEKAQLWLRFTVTGRQCHASAPDAGNNAFVAASALALRLNHLNSQFAARDSLFQPDRSTFTPTKHEENVQAVNILPGKDVFYLDCRLLPEANMDEIMARVRACADEVKKRWHTPVAIDVVQRRPACATPPDAPVVLALQKTIERICQCKAHVYGIGGATVASFLREKGLPAAVWSSIIGTCHQPNEASSIAATCRDAAVFGGILMDGVNA